MSDLPDRLRDWWTHDPMPENTSFCSQCGVRLPCDWNQAMAEMAEAADRIEELELALRECGTSNYDTIDKIVRRALGDDA